jgi:hypothetical protein
MQRAQQPAMPWAQLRSPRLEEALAALRVLHEHRCGSAPRPTPNARPMEHRPTPSTPRRSKLSWLTADEAELLLHAMRRAEAGGAACVSAHWPPAAGLLSPWCARSARGAAAAQGARARALLHGAVALARGPLAWPDVSAEAKSGALLLLGSCAAGGRAWPGRPPPPVPPA